ncbi:MAG: phosphoglucosamine mutase [Opitutales bacterium]
MGNYFGTDGIRGTFGGDLLNAAFARRFGRAIADFLIADFPHKPITVAVGRDTRASGVELESALSQGLCPREVHVIHLGVIPTPGVAMAVQQLHADLGIALTASHNPAEDNGIKLFDNRGHKLLPDTEERIERLIDATGEVPEAPTCGFEHDGRDHYVNFMRSLLHQDCLEGWKVVLDCANGATYRTSPVVLRQFGAGLTLLGVDPDGTNINAGVGSEYPERLAEEVVRVGANLGIAHDGDGDRCVLCDETGTLVHGDRLLGLLALHEIRQRRLQDQTLVATVQSNLGLDRALETVGGHVERTDVGDRNVLHSLLRGNFNLGGESSGHVIFPRLLEAGDGLMAAIKTLEVMLHTGKPLSALAAEVTLFPQLSRSLQIRAKRPLEACPSLQDAIDQANHRLGSHGRVLVRFSGTEPKIRLLVEADDEALLKPIMESFERAVDQDLGLA